MEHGKELGREEFLVCMAEKKFKETLTASVATSEASAESVRRHEQRESCARRLAEERRCIRQQQLLCQQGEGQNGKYDCWT